MDKRFPLHVRIIGYMQHKKQKTFLASVLWSDQNDVIVYRTFEEFKKLHRAIVKKFPLEAGCIKKSDRILPKFEDISRKERRQTRVSKSVLRIRMLEKYCNHLLSTSAKISKDQAVSQFFLLTNKDLAPSFPSDSIIIMPSAVEQKEDTWRRTSRTNAQSITQPVASENYTCIAPYETKDTKNKPFRVEKDEIVDVVTKNSSGWWLVENDEKQLAWFPAPYLKTCLNSAPSGASNINNETDECQYYAVKSYEATDGDELSMHVGVIVEVLKKSSDGWWLIRYNGQSGYVPSLYLQPYNNPHSKFQILTKADRYTSTPNLIMAARSPRTQSNNVQLNSHRYEANNYLSSTEILGANNGLYMQKSRSTNCLSDETIEEDQLSLPNSDESESRSESLSDDISLSTVSSGKSGLSEDITLSDSYIIRASTNVVSGQVEKNQMVASQSKTKNLIDSGVEAVGLKHSPEPSAGGSSTVTNLIPKIPPRPQRQEILSRCTTFTKNMVLRYQNDFDFIDSERKFEVTQPKYR
ncbi:NADPH oxidase organizer 1-like [Heptranchias perlo]|uniref:NADPH oxidase organizer 1-like n=1 Tax=Heptranchias perlo TaxID=212740 RepID=UPI003559AA54